MASIAKNISEASKPSSKIWELALKNAGFADMQAILRVVHATNNPEAALEVLLGIHEEPELSRLGCSDSKTYTLESVDCLKRTSDVVEFSYPTRGSEYIHYRHHHGVSVDSDAKKPVTEAFLSNKAEEFIFEFCGVTYCRKESLLGKEFGEKSGYNSYDSGKMETSRSTCSIDTWECRVRDYNKKFTVETPA